MTLKSFSQQCEEHGLTVLDLHLSHVQSISLYLLNNSTQFALFRPVGRPLPFVDHLGVAYS